MPLHTIAEAVQLTGKSRRTLYYYMDSGRITYSIGSDSRRHIETSELIRVFGEIRNNCTLLHTDTPAPDCTPEQLIAQLVSEVQQLREDNRQQAEQMNLMAERQAKELAAIREQLEERPLLEHQPKKVIERDPPPEPKPDKPAETSFKSIIQRLKEKQGAS